MQEICNSLMKLNNPPSVMKWSKQMDNTTSVMKLNQTEVHATLNENVMKVMK